MLDLARCDLDVGIVVHDTDAMLSFYGSVLELPTGGSVELPGRGFIHKFLVGSNVVKLFEPLHPVRANLDAAEYPWVRAGMQYWTLHVDDLDSVVAHLARHDVGTSTGVIETGYGPRYLLVADPDGNLVEFVEGVPRPGAARA
jgi:catechol 2,3-dioxygenase-like lactoylglutathione lyase family enzyme